MKYNGIKLIEMLPENWDGKTRSMLVWDDNSPSPYKKNVVGHFLRSSYWMTEDGNCWQYCAEIPTEEKEDAMKLLIDNENEILELKEENEKLKTKVNELKNSCSFQYYITMCNVKAKLKDKIENLEKENQELKEKNKLLRAERHEMASVVSNAVWKELMNRAHKNSYIGVLQMPAGFGFNDISDIVLNKILEYMSENKSEKKNRKMTYKELSEWLAKGKGQYKNGNFGSFRTELVYFKNEENTIVENDYLIRGFNETEWHEPLIEE